MEYGFQEIKEIGEETYKSFLNETMGIFVINQKGIVYEKEIQYWQRETGNARQRISERSCAEA